MFEGKKAFFKGMHIWTSKGRKSFFIATATEGKECMTKFNKTFGRQVKIYEDILQSRTLAREIKLHENSPRNDYWPWLSRVKWFSLGTLFEKHKSIMRHFGVDYFQRGGSIYRRKIIIWFRQSNNWQIAIDYVVYVLCEIAFKLHFNWIPSHLVRLSQHTSVIYESRMKKNFRLQSKIFAKRNKAA